MNVPLVSVIVPCYNYGAYLSNALDSIGQQSHTVWECIIVDDGSTDNTKEVALNYTQKDSRYRYMYQTNSGLSSARNNGIAASKGLYLQLLDADDMLESEKLRLQVSFLEENWNIDLMYSNVSLFRMLDGERKFEDFKFNQQVVSGQGKVLLDSLAHDNFFLPGCPLFRKSMAKDVGDFDPSLKAYEDWHYWYRAALLNKNFYYDDRRGTRLLSRSHSQNMSKQRHRMWFAKIKARTDLITLTKQGNEALDTPPVQNKFQLLKIHYTLLHRDKARFNLFFGNVFRGLGNIVKHIFYSGKPFFAVYDGAYWIKERAKKVIKK